MAYADQIRDLIRHFLSDKEGLQELRLKLGGDFLNEMKLGGWRMAREEGARKLRGIPDAAVEGAAIGLQLAEKGVRPSETGASEPPPPTSQIDPDLQSLMLSHRDALETTWLWGQRTWHLLRLELDDQNADYWNARVCRFWEKVQMLPAELIPAESLDQAMALSDTLESSIVHTSALDQSSSPEEARHIGDAEGDSIRIDGKRVYFSRQISADQNPVSCGYEYSTRQMYLRKAGTPAPEGDDADAPEAGEAPEKVDHDFFAGTNSVVVKESVLLVSLPTDAFDIDPYRPRVLQAYSFATLPNLMHRRYARLAIGARNPHYQGHFFTWGKFKIASPVSSAPALLERLKEIPAALQPEINNKMFGNQRTVFLARFEQPNPLCCQSVFWRLPE